MPRRRGCKSVPGAMPAIFAAVLIAALIGAPGGAVRAGAWPRQPGQWFLSTGTTLFAPSAPGGAITAESDLYAEGGLGGGWMAILQAARRPGGGEAVVGIGRASLYPDGSALGWSLALGRRWPGSGRAFTYLRPGLAWGRGFGRGTRLGPVRLPADGWISAEFQAEIRADIRGGPGAVVPKLDLTLGLVPSDRWALMLELWAEDYPGAPPVLRLGPAVVVRIGKAQLKVQPELPLAGGGPARITLALWSRF